MAMHKPGKESLRLARFPVDVLGRIVAFSSLSIPLWLCGDSILRNKLEEGVYELSLVDKRWISPGRTPEVITRFKRLHSLSVSLGSGPHSESRWNIAVQVDALAAQLQSLSLPGRAYQQLPSLPPNLTFLQIQRCHLDEAVCFRDMTVLPRTLETLDAGVTRYRQHDWSCSPPNLTTITSVFMQDKEPTLSFLPRSLRYSTLHLSQSMSLSMMRSLPPDLRKLAFTGTVDKESFTKEGTMWYSELPKSLETLACPGADSLTVDLLMRIPRTITEIIADRVDWDGLVDDEEAGRDFDIWPPNLERLATSHGYIYDYQLYLVPRTVKSFSTNFYFQKSSLDCTALPPSLTRFNWEIQARRGASPTNLAIKGRLPRNLRSWESGTGLKNFDSIQHLRSLTSLSIEWSRIPTLKKEQVTLPDSLTRITTSRWRWDWLDVLPRGLVSIDFDMLDGTPEPVNGDCFARLPLGLRKLAMGGTQVSTATKEELSFGPHNFLFLRHLESIDVPFLGLFDSAIVRRLSTMRYLRVLDITLASLDPRDAPFVPQNLNHDLSLGQHVNPLDPQIAPYWPGAEPPPTAEQMALEKKRKKRWRDG